MAIIILILQHDSSHLWQLTVTVVIRQVKNQRVIVLTGLFILRPCICSNKWVSSCSAAFCPHHPLMPCELTACPCAGNAMHCMQLLPYAITPCVLQLLSTAEAYSERCWQLSLLSLSVCRPGTLCCQKLKLKVQECAVSALQLWWRTHFFIRVASLKQGYCIKTASANNEKRAFPLKRAYGMNALWECLTLSRWRVKPIDVY